MNDFDVLVVGSLHLDIVVEDAQLPVIDETSRGQSWKMVCGGKGGNQACWAARCGARTAMVACIGRDDFGTRLLDNLQTHGVETSLIQTSARTGSGISVAIVQSDGDYGAAIVSGSNHEIDVQVVISALQACAAPRIVLLQNEIDEAVNLAMAQWAKAAGALVVFNAAPARPANPAFAGLIDVLVVNRVEAAMMSRGKINTRADALDALTLLCGLADTVVITLGSDGLVYAKSGAPACVIEASKVNVSSTHGAGDCLVGQLCAALVEGVPLSDALSLANRTAGQFVAGLIG